MNGRQAEASTASTQISSPVKTLTLQVRTLVAERNSFTAQSRCSFSKSTTSSSTSCSGLMLSGLS